jgi:hypothetical protein
LDTRKRKRLGRGWRAWFERQSERWTAIDRSWRRTILLLVRIQNRYFASVRGTLTTSQWSAPLDLETGQHVDYLAMARNFDADLALRDLGMTAEEVKTIHHRLGFAATTGDPLGHWSLLARMAPYRERQKLGGEALRVQDFYDAADMLRRFYHDLTGDLLPHPDEMTDASDGSWRVRVFGHPPRLNFTRNDLRAELQRHGLYPSLVHLVVEGETEVVLFERLIGAMGISPSERGVSISTYHGVGQHQLRQEILRVARRLSRFPVLVTDREGEVEKEIEALKRDGLLRDETTFLWNKNLEEDNFTDAELVELAKRAAKRQGVELRLSARTLRTKYEERCRRAPVGLAEFLLERAAHPRHGSARLSKRVLAEEMATYLLDEFRTSTDSEDLAKRRPLMGVLFSIRRPT